MFLQDTAEDGTLGPYALEGAALWALALLRAGHPDDGLARLLPVLRLDGEAQLDELVTLFEDEAAVTDDAALNAWTVKDLTLRGQDVAWQGWTNYAAWIARAEVRVLVIAINHDAVEPVLAIFMHLRHTIGDLNIDACVVCWQLE